MRSSSLVAAIVIAGATCVFAAAREMDRPTSTTVIHDAEGRSRVLFRLEGIEPAERTGVLRASLSFTPSPTSQRKSARLRIHAVTRPWTDGAVDWDSGWTRPGGDYDEAAYIPFDVDLGESPGTIQVDITALAQALVKGEIEPHGFLLMPDPEEKIGIDSADIGAFESWGTATVTIVTRQVPTRSVRRDSEGDTGRE